MKVSGVNSKKSTSIVAQFITWGSIYVNPLNIYIFNNNSELIHLKHMIVMNRAIILIIYKNKIENIFIKLLKIRYIILVDPNFTGFQISRLIFRWSGWVNGRRPSGS